MKPPHRDAWENSNKIGLRHGYDRRPDPYLQPESVWDNPSSGYGSSSWNRAPVPAPIGYDSYGSIPARGPAPLAYRDDPYYGQPSLAPPVRSNYYDDVEPVPYQSAPYGSYSLAEPMARRPAPYPDYGPGYDRYEPVDRYPPRRQEPLLPMYEVRPQRRDREGNNDYFSGRRDNRSCGPLRSNPRKRERNSNNRRSNSSFNDKNGKESRVKKREAKEDDEAPDFKRDPNGARFLFEKIDNATELFEKCQTLGEARHRQFRYKLYRCLNTLGIDFVTITEQKGTFAKTGTLKTKVILKDFFPQILFGEADGTEHDKACFEATVQLALKLNEYGLLSCNTIANFFNKRIHYKPEKFEQAKAKFKLLLDEVAKHEFTPEFKEGKIDSDEQLALLKTCIKTVADKISEDEKAQLAEKISEEVQLAEKISEEVQNADKISEEVQNAVDEGNNAEVKVEESSNVDSSVALESENPADTAQVESADSVVEAVEEKSEQSNEMECTDEA